MLKKYAVAKVAFLIGLTVVAWFSVIAATFAVLGALLIAFVSRADQISEFSFGPLKAKLERTLSESERLVASLRKLAVIQAKLAVATSARTGRWSQNDAWFYHGVRELEGALKEIGASNDELTAVRADFVNFTLIDLGHAVLGGSTAPLFLGQEAVEEWKRLRRQSVADPDAIAEWLSQHNLLTDSRVQMLNDMRWIRDNGDVQSEEQFMRCQAEPLQLRP